MLSPHCQQYHSSDRLLNTFTSIEFIYEQQWKLFRLIRLFRIFDCKLKTPHCRNESLFFSVFWRGFLIISISLHDDSKLCFQAFTTIPRISFPWGITEYFFRNIFHTNHTYLLHESIKKHIVLLCVSVWRQTPPRAIKTSNSQKNMISVSTLYYCILKVCKEPLISC